MKKLRNILLWFIAIIVIIVITVIFYFRYFLPNVGAAPDITVEATPQQIARGEYLAMHVTVCVDCHSKRDWSKFSGPPVEGTYGIGGAVFDRKFGFPGSYYASNITPYGINNYTDGELFRVITTGVNKDGKAMFPVMPCNYYGKMDEEDIKCIIAYIRTLTPIKNEVPGSSSDFPMNFLINTLPHKASFTKMPAKTDVVNYGKYMTNAAACMDCHTQIEKGNLIAGMEFGGGREFPFPDGSIVRSSNITPDEETGIGKWSEGRFVNSFYTQSDSATLNTKLNPGVVNSVMPWTMYGKMTEEDLKAIYAYLKTIKPIKNAVRKFTYALKK